MKSSKSYVLVIDQGSDDLHRLEFLLKQLRCPVEVVYSTDQAMTKARQLPPCLMILAGNQHHWSKSSISRFRHVADCSGTTIVALTDFHAPSWLRQEDNPGVDGFLVKPLNGDVLNSLVQSAWVRQACYTPQL